MDYHFVVYGLQDTVRDFPHTHGEPTFQGEYVIVREMIDGLLTITPLPFSSIIKFTMDEITEPQEPVVETVEGVAAEPEAETPAVE